MVSLPTNIRWRSGGFNIQWNNQTFTSQLNGYVQRALLPGAKWVATFSTTPHTKAEIQTLLAFFDSLQGQYGTFDGYDLMGVRRGAGGGTPLVNGASQTGTSIITDGWPNSTAILKQGDYIKFNNELKRVAADVSSDGSGNATITFQPPIRTSPANNAPITVHNPPGTLATVPMMLTTSLQNLEWSLNLYQPIQFSAMEVLS